MNILVPTAVALVGLAVAYRLYPRYIARVFQEDDRHAVPSRRLADGVDYVPSRTHVVFGHHYATIAGAGPIVGPTLALAFGWQPVWLWVLLGGIFFGAVHDMSALFTSVREQGKTIGEIARRALGPAGYVLFVLVLIFVLTLINAIFLNLSITALTSIYPLAALNLPPDQTLLGTVVDGGAVKAHIGGIATTSVIVITACAPALGWLIRHESLSTRAAYLLALVVCVASIVLGFWLPVRVDGETWRYLMTAYVFLACALPLWFILQPRDFTNVQILYGGQLLLLVSVVIAGAGGVTIQAPAVATAEGAALMHGPMWPLLFITVACGAISGFHSLVASGTTVKQLPKESDCRRVGYGAMVVESFLAVLVIVAVASMLPRSEYLALVYPPDAQANPILGFAVAAGRLVHAALPIVPVAIAVVIGILMVEGFVVTTLDSSVRLCRYLLEEFWGFAFGGAVPAVFRSIYLNTGIAVGLMFFFSVSGTVRQMWPVFGAGNQLIGALALVTVSVWLAQRARQTLFALVPALFMIATTIAALAVIARVNLAGVNTVLGVTAVGLFVLAIGVVIVGAGRFVQALQAEAPKPLVTVEP
ncbi:MAG: carbon starvation protein A [Luteitalea sp.]|nr:carbon starvation protein A [Luteitalea sp.]